ncbi:MAG: DUF2807 domain-containing protein [Deltaproteobacteria bacterium]|jgi:hypothetical protein|nr:DUF2807 domain-containing protein [Deltaproteobacteria bacterium]
MKVSNMILSGAFLGVLGIGILILLVVKFSMDDHPPNNRLPVESSAKVVKKIKLTGFKEVDLKGKWQVRIVQADEKTIRIEGPEDLLADLLVNHKGSLVELHMPEWKNDRRKLFLEITMPSIKSLKILGVADVSISGFILEDLMIHVEGVTSIHGENGSTGKLEFMGKGVSKLDLQNFPTRSADLAGKGVIKIELTMAGGELTGSIEGVGHVRYKGKAGHESIKVKGPCKVTRS